MHDFVWTTDHDAALCFKSEQQADHVMMAVRSLSRGGPTSTQFGSLFAFETSLGNAKAVEHGWMAEAS